MIFEGNELLIEAGEAVEPGHHAFVSEFNSFDVANDGETAATDPFSAVDQALEKPEKTDYRGQASKEGNSTVENATAVESDNMGAILKRARATRLLSAEEEQAYFAEIHRAVKSLKSLFIMTNNIDMLRNCMHPICKQTDDLTIAHAETFDHAKIISASKSLLNDAQVTEVQEKEIDYSVQRLLKYRELVFNANLRLVISISKKFWTNLYELADIVQEGSLGLLHAISKFDPGKGFRFSTYAYWWIQQRVFRFVSDNWRLIRLPSNVTDDIRQWRKLRSAEKRKGNSGLPVPDRERLSTFNQKFAGQDVLNQHHLLSLDSSTAFEDAPKLEQIIPSKQASLENRTDQSLVKRRLKEAIATLPERESVLISMRFGLTNGTPHTRNEAAQQLGVSVERVRQLELRALAHLKKTLPDGIEKHILEK